MAFKAPPGYTTVKQPNGRYKLVKKGAAAAKPTTTKPAGPVGPAEFVGNEIARQIAQDAALTNYTDTATGEIANQMGAQSNAAAAIASQYAPVTTFTNPTLDANAQQRVAQDVGLTNTVLKDQAGSLAGLIAKSGSAGTDLMGNMRGAARRQHQEYAQRIEGQRAGLEEQRRNELRAAAQQKLAMETQRMQNTLAQKEFGMRVDQQAADNAYRDANPTGGGSEGESAEAPAKGIYGFGADRDDALGAVITEWTVGLKPGRDKEGNVIPIKYKQPWRDLHQLLKSIGGLNQDQAALLATKIRPEGVRNAPGGAIGVLKMLKARKVTPKVQAFIIKTYFGKETWANLSSGGARRPAGAGSGTYQPGAQRVPSNAITSIDPNSPIVYQG